MRQTSLFSMFILLMSGLFVTIDCQDVPTVAINHGFVVDYGQSFILNCSINASSQVTELYWEKDSNGLTSKLEAGLAGTQGMTLDNPSLTITFASMRDSGSYRCIASNSVGTGKSKVANITVHGGLPVIQTFKTNYSVVFGSSITMVCNVTAFPKLMHVNWQQNNSGILRIINEGAVGTDGILPNNPSLTLKSTSFADNGMYYCSATNMAGTERSVAIHLSVIGGTPSVEIPKANHSVDYGEEITIECRSSAIPKFDEIVWEKTVNGIHSLINNRSSGIRGSTFNNPSLTILNATLTDSGDYTCLAKNKVGIGKSQKTSVTVHGAIPSVLIGAPIYSVIFGRKVSLHCDITAEPEHTLVYWERNNNGAITTINFQAIGTTGITLNSPSLTLEFPTFADQGTYTCIAANAIGIGQSKPTTLTISGDLPIVTIRKPHYIANYGETITLECKISSAPTYTAMYWQKFSVGSETNITAEFPGANGVDSNNPSLTVQFVTPSDAGLYSCFAVNAIGIGKSKHSTVSVIADIPFTVIEKSSYTAFIGLSIEIKCTVQSVPRHTYVYWTHSRNNTNSVIIPGTVGFKGLSADNPSLVIPSVNLFMSGEYKCIAINEIGSGISLPATLIVAVMDNITRPTEFSTTDPESNWLTEIVTSEVSSKPFSREVGGHETSQVVSQDPLRITTPTNRFSTELITETTVVDLKENTGNGNQSNGLSPGEIAGIVIGVVVFLVLLILIGVAWLMIYALGVFLDGCADCCDKYSP